MTCKKEKELALVFLAPPLSLHNPSLIPLSDPIFKFCSPPPLRVWYDPLALDLRSGSEQRDTATGAAAEDVHD